jgi:hypothetical protein
MSLRIDSTAAAYGVFQVVFADMTEHLARSLYRLQQPPEPIDRLWNRLSGKFSLLLSNFKDALKQFDGYVAHENAILALRQACIVAREISRWRNSRIHAHVRIVDDGLALYDREGERLSMTSQECQDKIREAYKVIVTLKTHILVLSRTRELSKLIDQSSVTQTRLRD